MAKVQLNSSLTSLSGKMDNWVYRRTRDGTLVGKRPITSGTATPAQRAVRENFRQAAAYAKSALLDSSLRSRYDLASRSSGLSSYAFAVTDFLTPPVVASIDTGAYHGRSGDVIMVTAFDDFEVAGVTVAVKDGDGELLMEGNAVLTDGRWAFTTGAGISAGETITIEAVAKDRPGHTGSASVTLTIA